MSKIAVVTDSNSGITQAMGGRIREYMLLPMPFYIDGELYLEDITLTQEQFYQKLRSGCGDIYFAAFPGKCDGTVGKCVERI